MRQIFTSFETEASEITSAGKRESYVERDLFFGGKIRYSCWKEKFCFLVCSGRQNLLKASINHPIADASLSVFLILIVKIYDSMEFTSKPKMWL